MRLQKFVHECFNLLATPSSDLMAIALEVSGTLPKTAKDVISRADMYRNVRVSKQQIEQGSVFTITKLCKVAQESRFVMEAGAVPEKAQEECKFVQHNCDDHLQGWFKKNDCSRFSELQPQLSVVLEAAEKGDYSSCPWLASSGKEGTEQQQHTEMKERIEKYEAMFSCAPTAVRVGEFIRPLVAEENIEKLSAVVKDAQKVVEMRDEVAMVLITVAIGNTLLQKPRLKTFSADLKAGLEYAATLNVKVANLPADIKRMLAEANKTMENGTPNSEKPAESASEAPKEPSAAPPQAVGRRKLARAKF